jgi:hypothetical protein
MSTTTASTTFFNNTNTSAPKNIEEYCAEFSGEWTCTWNTDHKCRWDCDSNSWHDECRCVEYTSTKKKIDVAIYVVMAIVFVGSIIYFFVRRRQRTRLTEAMNREAAERGNTAVEITATTTPYILQGSLNETSGDYYDYARNNNNNNSAMSSSTTAGITAPPVGYCGENAGFTSFNNTNNPLAPQGSSYPSPPPPPPPPTGAPLPGFANFESLQN